MAVGCVSVPGRIADDSEEQPQPLLPLPRTPAAALGITGKEQSQEEQRADQLPDKEVPGSSNLSRMASIGTFP